LYFSPVGENSHLSSLSGNAAPRIVKLVSTFEQPASNISAPAAQLKSLMLYLRHIERGRSTRSRITVSERLCPLRGSRRCRRPAHPPSYPHEGRMRSSSRDPPEPRSGALGPRAHG